MQAVAQNLQRIRKQRGVSLRGLAARTLDRPAARLPANAIHEIEQGVRRVDVDDLMSLAAALDVSPALLLMPQPDLPDEEGGGVVYLFDPEEPLAAEQVWDWITGHAPLRDEPWWDALERAEGVKAEIERRWYDERMRREWHQRSTPKFAWERENRDGTE